MTILALYSARVAAERSQCRPWDAMPFIMLCSLSSYYLVQISDSTSLQLYLCLAAVGALSTATMRHLRAQPVYHLIDPSDAPALLALWRVGHLVEAPPPPRPEP
jgi:hypothetical protein